VTRGVFKLFCELMEVFPKGILPINSLFSLFDKQKT